MGASSHVVVVAACTNRKRGVVDPRHKLRDLGRQPTSVRLADWQGRIRSAPGSAVVRGLYAGDHWCAVLTAVDLLRSGGWRVDLWVMSAGLGLQREDAVVPSYSATFASGEPDSVWRPEVDGSRVATLRGWWCGLVPEPPVEWASRDKVVVVGGRSYLEATESSWRVPNALVLSAGGGTRGAVQFDARLRLAVGGTLGALNARAFLALARSVDRHAWDRSAVQRELDDLVEGLALPEPDRVTLDDDEVAIRIGTILASSPTASRTDALRALREGGGRCEQARFASIFNRVRTGL